MTPGQQFPDLNEGLRAIAASQHRSGGPSDPSRQEASQPSGRSSHIAGDLLMLAFLFLFIFGLPGLFAGV